MIYYLILKYLPFEEYLYKIDYAETIALASSSSANAFRSDRNPSFFEFPFSIGDYVIIEGDSISFYNGVQKCLSITGVESTGFTFFTDKPPVLGTSTSGGIIKRADNESSEITEHPLSSEKTAYYSGLKLKDIAGLSNIELNDLN